jgi:hypothetical protein
MTTGLRPDARPSAKSNPLFCDPSGPLLLAFCDPSGPLLLGSPHPVGRAHCLRRLSQNAVAGSIRPMPVSLYSS